MLRDSLLLSAAGVSDRRSAALTPVKIASLQCEDKSLGCGDICGNGYIMNITEPEKVHVIDVVGLGIDRIPEEQQYIYLIT